MAAARNEEEGREARTLGFGSRFGFVRPTLAVGRPIKSDGHGRAGFSHQLARRGCALLGHVSAQERSHEVRITVEPVITPKF